MYIRSLSSPLSSVRTITDNSISISLPWISEQHEVIHPCWHCPCRRCPSRRPGIRCLPLSVQRQLCCGLQLWSSLCDHQGNREQQLHRPQVQLSLHWGHQCRSDTGRIPLCSPWCDDGCGAGRLLHCPWRWMVQRRHHPPGHAGPRERKRLCCLLGSFAECHGLLDQGFQRPIQVQDGSLPHALHQSVLVVVLHGQLQRLCKHQPARTGPLCKRAWNDPRWLAVSDHLAKLGLVRLWR